MTEHRTTYSFSSFRIDTKNKVLWRDGAVVPLTPKVFDTLALLVENAPDLVAKSSLMEALWPDQFVEESNITFNIKMLRKALEDDAGNPTFIETVPRRGYRFIAKLDEGKQAAPEYSAWTRRPGYAIGFLALLAVAGIIGLAAWRVNTNSAAPNNLSNLRSTKLSDTGKVNRAVISPDGKFIAYTNEEKRSLWLRQISNGSNTEILPASDLPFFGLAFSNDSENLFFTRREFAEDFQLSIYRKPIFGGVPAKIAGDAQGDIGITPDDRQIIFIRYEKGVNNQNSLMTIDVDGQNERVIKTSAAPDVFWTAAVSPDGQKVIAAYGHTNNAARNVSLVEIDLATGDQREITDEKFFQVSSLAWLEDQSGFLFTAYKTLGEPARIWRFEYTTRKAESITNDSTEYVKITLNKLADKFVVTTLSADFGFFIGREQNTSRYLTQARDGFSFTPDGRIVYASDASESEDIWIMNENGSDQKQLTTDPSLDAYPLVSADGHIYFASNRTGENQIWRMNLDGSGQTRITKSLGGKPRFVTQDGKWLFYSSAIDQTVWKAATNGTGEKQVFPTATGFYQAFSPDGSKMAYLARDKDANKFAVRIISIEKNEDVKRYPVADGDGLPYFLNWSPDGTGLTYTRKDQTGDHLLWQQPLNSEAPNVLSNLGNEEVMDCRLAPNGKNYVFIRGRWKHDAVLLSGSKPAAAPSNSRGTRALN
jgi:DNA-binding winged helix-turn-helix (wHTH) protein/Tol biopolymer transport system component